MRLGIFWSKLVLGNIGFLIFLNEWKSVIFMEIQMSEEHFLLRLIMCFCFFVNYIEEDE